MTVADPPLFILGASGHAAEIAAYARLAAPMRQITFVDFPGGREDTVPRITPEDYAARGRAAGGESVMGAGRCEVRQKMDAEVVPPFATIIHPAASVMGAVSPGCVLAPGAVIAPGAALHEHVLVNYNATIGHDAVIGRLSVVGPGAAISGGCVLEHAVYVGAGALIREGLTIGAGAVIGMGAVVTRDVAAGAVVAGVPARDRTRTEGGTWLRR